MGCCVRAPCLANPWKVRRRDGASNHWPGASLCTVSHLSGSPWSDAPPATEIQLSLTQTATLALTSAPRTAERQAPCQHRCSLTATTTAVRFGSTVRSASLASAPTAPGGEPEKLHPRQGPPVVPWPRRCFANFSKHNRYQLVASRLRRPSSGASEGSQRTSIADCLNDGGVL